MKDPADNWPVKPMPAPAFTESDLLEVARRAVHEYPNGRSSDELIAEVVRDFIKEREASNG